MSIPDNHRDTLLRPMTEADLEHLSIGQRLYSPHSPRLFTGYTITDIARDHHEVRVPRSLAEVMDDRDDQPQELVSYFFVRVSLKGDARSEWGFNFYEGHPEYERKPNENFFIEITPADVADADLTCAFHAKVAEVAYHVVTVRVRVPITEGSADPETHKALVEGALLQAGYDVARGTTASSETGVRVNVYRREADYSAAVERGKPLPERLIPVAVSVRSEEAFAFCPDGIHNYRFENVDDNVIVGDAVAVRGDAVR